jgi:glyceraldehyde-3-phosphate dehydrogenase/erythrose-4-phosphate dehydrogenase
MIRTSIVDTVSMLVIDCSQMYIHAWLDNERDYVNHMIDSTLMIARAP